QQCRRCPSGDSDRRGHGLAGPKCGDAGDARSPCGGCAMSATDPLVVPTAFLHVCNMEEPISAIRHLTGAIFMMVAAMDDGDPDTAAVNQVAREIRRHLNIVEDQRGALWRLLRPFPSASDPSLAPVPPNHGGDVA